MTTLDTTMQMPAATRPAVLARMIRGGVSLVQSWRNRKAFAQLSNFSDRELADIGLVRSDLFEADRAAMLDPTSELRGVAVRRIALEDAARRVS